MDNICWKSIAFAVGLFGAGLALPLHPASAEGLKDIAVKWDIGTEDWSKKCGIDLRTEKASHGMTLVKADGCAAAFPVMAKVESWQLTGTETIDLLGGAGELVLRFVLHEGNDMYSPEPAVDGIYTIALNMD